MQLQKTATARFHRTLLICLLLGIVSTGLFGCGGALISTKEEREIGANVHLQIKKEYKLIKPSDPVGKWALEFLRPLKKASYTFRSLSSVGGYRIYVISDDKLINAFAAPGGYTYITTGLILSSSNCAELAGVMGHELAHVTERHGVKKLESAMAVETAGGILFGEGAGKENAQVIWGFLQNTTFSREDESEADEVGLQISKRAGYDPYGLAAFFRKLMAHEGGGPEFLSSHPASKKRVRAVERSIRRRYGSKAKPGKLGRTSCKTKMKLADLKKRLKTRAYKLLN